MNYLDAKSNSPKYWQLAERFRKQLKSGALKPGDRLPTLIEMRDDHNISRTTVEKAYGLLERDGLIEKLHGSGVFVSQPRRRSTQGVIGLSGAGFSFNSYSPYWAQILGGVQDAASSIGFQVLMLDSKSRVGWEKADGVLICDWNDYQAPPNFPEGLPVVSLLVPVKGIASVTADDEEGMCQAVERLIQLGHRRIAYLHGDDSENSVTWNRLASYHEALKAACIVSHKSWTRLLGGKYWFGSEFTLGARKNMQGWLHEDWGELGCTALLCQNDEAAMGAIQALNDAGIRVPHDVSVVGFDGTEFCDLVSPKLSSVQLPLREIGAVGIKMLLQQITDEKVSKAHRVLPVQLREGESSAAPRAQ